MSKSLLYRLFRAGEIPGDAKSQIHIEGLLLSDEGLRGSITFRNFRSPGRYSKWRRNWFSGSLVLTKRHFLAFRYKSPVIGVAWDDPRIRKLACSVEKKNTLCVIFDATTFNDHWSGEIEIRFTTPLARSFLEQIKRNSG